MEKRIGAIAGVTGVGAIQVLPMTQGTMGVGISPDGNPLADDERPLFVSYRTVSPGYAETIGIPLVDGRHLRPSDRAAAAPVGLVNQAMAKTLWPGERSVVGREVRWDNGELWFTVVGVLGDVHQHALSQEARAEAYVPYAQDAWATAMYLLIRAEGATPLASARDAVWAVDRNIPVTGLRSMTEVVETSLATPRFHSTLFGAFALLAIVLAGVGIYGVSSQLVNARRQEIGIRLAFGATHRDVLRWLGRLGVAPVVVGLSAGIGVALIGTRLIASLLYGVRPTDPIVFAVAVAVLVVVALAAFAMPAKRALATDPITSMKTD